MRWSAILIFIVLYINGLPSCNLYSKVPMYEDVANSYEYILEHQMNHGLHEIYKFLNRGYYTVARRYEFYFRVAKQYFTNERSEWVKYCFCHEEIKFISSSRSVMFFLLYRQKDIDKIIEGNYQNYVIDKLTREIMENKPLGSRMLFLWILRVVYFPVKHSCLYNKKF